MHRSWVFSSSPNLSAVSLSGTICWETMHYVWVRTRGKKSHKQSEKLQKKRTRRLCKNTGLHITVRHDAHGLQVDGYNHYPPLTRMCFCHMTVTFKETQYKTSSSCFGGVKQSLQTLGMNVLIVRSFKWKQRVGLRYTICSKCLCKGYALGLSHSLLHDCTLHLRFHFALWCRKPCIEACSSAASLQRPRWGRDPERCMVLEQKGCK